MYAWHYEAETDLHTEIEGWGGITVEACLCNHTGSYS